MSQRGKRGNNHRLECDPQPPPTKRRKGRPPNGSTAAAIGVAAGATGSKATTSSNTNDNDHPEGAAAANSSGNSSAVSLPPPIPMASAASTSHTISSKLPSSSTSGIGSGAGTSSSVPWQARSVADIKISSIYNRSSTEAPAELYRKDLISAMKLPDSEPLASHEYLIVTDQWKQEWEKGVQVPVNPDSLPEPSVFVMQKPIVDPAHDFKLPKNRYIRITKDDSYTSELHYLTNVVALAENTCAYDIDQVDEVWLNLLNKERALSGATPITSEQFERVIEELEIRCWEQIQVILKNEEGLGIEYDENVICDVCRSPDSEEANEMVFCDNCNICVHQACYGITAIPSGQWLCRTCSMNISPGCVLCPNKGGAMKSTKSGKNWAHVSCALWIPEVSIGCVDRMEPITKISSIPQSRWALICVLCKERVGACIQCSVKTCKTAYHVTCAFQHGLEMRAIIEEGNAEDGVKLRSYCLKHSMGSKGKKGNQKCTNNNGLCSGIDDDDCRRRKSRKDMTSEERNQVRALRLQEVEAEFDRHVNIRDISCHLFECDEDAIASIYNYWKLKRKSRNNHALIPPKSEDVELIARKQEQADLENHKLFVHLRQDLERVRNLCYMVSRREKLSRSLFKLREQIFYKQISVLSDDSLRNTKEYDENFTNAVIYANDGPALYDRFYTSSNYQGDNSFLSLEYIKEKLLGESKSNKSQASSAAASTSATAGGSGAFSTTNRKKSISQYKKINVNGAKATRRNGGGDHRADSSGTQSSSSSSTTSAGSSGSSGSSSSSASSASSASSVSSASENESTKKKSSPLKQRKKQSYSCSIEMRQKRRKASAVAAASSAVLAASSSSDEDDKKQESHKRRNNFLSQMEKELEKDKGALSSSNESEELIPLKNLDNTSKNISRKATAQIYSDSDSSTSTSEEDKDKTESNVSDYQTNIRTKAAMKEFTLQQSIQKQKKEAAAAKAKEDVNSGKDKEKGKDKIKGKETSKENLRTEGSFKDKKDDRNKKSNKTQDSAVQKSVEKQKFVTDLLVVPQRQAAKKASENMRSTNSYSSTATAITGSAGSKKDSRDDRESDRTQVCPSRDKDKDKDKEKDREREKEKDKPKESSSGSRLDEKTRSKEKDKEKEKPTEKVAGKRGRPPKNPPKDESISTSSKDIVSPRREKVQAKSDSAKSSSCKLTTESPNSIKATDMTKNNILVAYVPQRQAAKKAAEQLKSGMGKNSTTEVAIEEKESKDKESKLKSPESNKKQASSLGESHTTKPRRLSKEVITKEASLKEVAPKEPATTSRTTATRRSKDSTADIKESETKVPATAPAPSPAPAPAPVPVSASVQAPVPASLSGVSASSSSIEKNKNKEEKEGSRRSSVQNVNLTSTSESSSSSSSSCSSSSSDDSEVEENRKSTTTRKLSKSSGGEKPTKKAASTVTQDEAPKSPTPTSGKSPRRSKLPSLSQSNNDGSSNGSKETLKKEEILPPRQAESPKIPAEEKKSEPAPIVLDDDDDEDEVSKGKASPEKEKEEDITAPQTIEIDDDEVTKASPSPNLEEEITQRKADLVSSSSIYNNTSTNSSLSNTSKSHRNFGSLDKLLNKKERELSSNNSSAMDERKSSSSAAESTSNMESDTFIEDLKESQEEDRPEEERIPTPTIKEKCSRSIRIEDPDIIELDSNSAQSLKIDSYEPQPQEDEAHDNSSEKPPQTPPLPLSSEESQKILEQSPATPAAHHHHRTSFDPTSEDQINLLDNIQEPDDDNDDDDDDDDDATAALTEFSFSQAPDTERAAHEPTTDHETHKEDDSALTMNLVKKLRQSQSQKRNHNKCDDVPTDFGPPPTPAIPTTFPYNHHAEDLFQQKENSAPTTQLKDDSLLPDDKAGSDPPAVAQLTNNNSCSLIVPFSENAINFLDKTSTHSSIVQFPSLQSSNEQQQSQHILQDSTAVNDASSLFLSGTGMGDKKKTPQSSSINNSECFNKLTDFKQPDFVDLHATKETSMDFTTNAESVSSKLVDCDYDENTRMQSPYMNAPNMWNENDLIQTRRSVSTSPSSVSESNDLPHQLTPCSKSNQQPQQQQQDCNIVVNQKSHFGGGLESFGGALSSQFNSITQQNNTSQNMVNGIDMISSSYGFGQQQQQANHSQNQYNGPVSLFHAPPPHANIPNHMNQISFPTPGAVLFPSAGLAGNVPLSASQSQQQSQQQSSSMFGGNHQNHQQETPPSAFMTSMSTGNGGSGGAAFTSSSHNLALTAAIVSTPGATLDHHSPQFNAASAQFNSLLELMPPSSNANNKESPSKRTSARFSQQQPPLRKSPQMHKSPGKSPRQMELLSKQMGPKSCSAKFDGQTTGRQRKNSTRGAGTGRGRGRGRGRGGRLSSSSQIPPAIDYGNTHIVNNLVGTPYEFNYEEDMASSNVENLQSLRDRRRSFDCRGNLQQNTTPEQQKFSSPSYTCKMRSSTQTTASNNCNSRQGDLKTPASNTIVNTNSEVSSLRSIVSPVLPGPVDMRTYSLDFEAQHSSASQEAYNNNLLGAFDSGTADQTLPDIDEEVEKEFQSALKASGTGIRHTQNSQPVNASEVVMPAELQTSMETTSEEISIDSDTTNTKVSLSDSRNQLKLKIKGPLAYPDMYNSTNLTVQQSSVQVSVSQVTIGGGSSTVSGGGGGTSGIRRMRKKELLQYWGQKETNLDDTVGLPPAEKQASSSDALLSRCVGIPKAVDSMLSIPTKDDYKGYNSTETTSKRKKFGSRELRQLDMSYDVTEGNPERRRSGCSTGSNLSVSNETGGKTTGKRRGRSKTHESEEEQAPKLKIKIRKKSYESTSTTASGGSTGNGGVGASTNMRIVSCPPKKRLTSNYVIPSFEMLRRESMNYRKKVMADFGDDDEEKPSVSADKLEVQPHTSRKKSSKQKKEHKKKKKQDKHIQVIENNASDAAPKLIIRFGKRKVEEEGQVADDSITKASEATLPIVPIRLKLARNSDGGGYVIGNKQQSLQHSIDQQDQSEENTAESDRLSGETPKGTGTIKTNQPVPPLKLRTNFHSEQSATDINAGYSNSSNSSSSTPPSALPPLSSDTAKTDAAASMGAPTDPSAVKSLSAAANDCSLLPLNKDCEVR